jgi:HlyD family secretion protein
MKKFLNFFKRPLGIITILIIVIILVPVIIFHTKSKAIDEIYRVQKGKIVQEIDETGIVKPSKSIDLSFEKGGRVAEIYVQLGDEVVAGQNLIKLENSDLYAQLLQAKANLKAQEARLEELKKGARPEEIQSAKTTLEQAKINLINAIQESYSKSIDAVKNKIDQMFIKSDTVYQASLNSNFYGAGDFSLRSSIESKRLAIEIAFRQWKDSLVNLTPDKNLDSFTEEAKTNLNLIRDLTNRMNDYFNSIDPNSPIALNYLGVYRNYVSSANATINATLSALLAAEQNYKSAQNQLTLKTAGATTEQIKAQEAQVDSAKANVMACESQLSKTILKSPIDGVVAKINIKVGELINSMNPTESVISIIAKSKFEIETNIPEVDIAKIKIGDKAKITFDAFGNDVVFEATVSRIDLASTMIEGVPTYKTVLTLNEDDDRIVSGMTANITIIPTEKNDVLIIPYRTVTSEDNKKFVFVKTNQKQPEKREIKLGIRGSNGDVEVIAGLEEGEEIIIPTNK